MTKRKLRIAIIGAVPETSCCNSKARSRDGTTHISMSPLEFMQRLAALLPRPRPLFQAA